MRIDQSWCPNCQEFTVTDAGRPCVWCDTRTVAKRGGWKRPDKTASSRISPAQARALHAAHQHLSLRDIAAKVYETLGYKTQLSCLEGMRAAFRREGLTGRSQPAATSLANVQRGKRLPGETPQEYKRRRRREVGYRDHRTGEWRIAA